MQNLAVGFAFLSCLTTVSRSGWNCIAWRRRSGDKKETTTYSIRNLPCRAAKCVLSLLDITCLVGGMLHWAILSWPCDILFNILHTYYSMTCVLLRVLLFCARWRSVCAPPSVRLAVCTHDTPPCSAVTLCSVYTPAGGMSAGRVCGRETSGWRTALVVLVLLVLLLAGPSAAYPSRYTGGQRSQLDNAKRANSRGQWHVTHCQTGQLTRAVICHPSPNHLIRS